jgi:glycosyltransferase involved in cell wall biosynthesis
MHERKSRILLLSWYSFEKANSGERVRVSALCRELESDFRVITLDVEGPLARRSHQGLSLPSDIAIPYVVPKIAYLQSTLRGMAIERYLLNSGRTREAAEVCIDAVRPDAILASQPYVWPLIPVRFRSISIMDTHNINSARLNRLKAAMSSSDPRKLILWRQVYLSRRFERSYSELAGQIWTVSEEDAERVDFRFRHKVRIVPNGADFPSNCPERRAVTSPVRVLFFGALNYSANLDGLQQLRNWVDADVIRKERNFRVTVAGSGDPKKAVAIIGEHPSFDFIGEVNSPSELYRDHDCLIVPLRQGGGSRLKVLEAVASGLPVLSTEVGVEGTGLLAARDYLPVERASDVVKQIRLLTEDDQFVRMMTRSAFAKCKSVDWAAIGARAGRFVRELISDTPTNDCG